MTSGRKTTTFIGQKINRWTLIARVPYPPGDPHSRCRCDCGNERVISHASFAGKSKSCGCFAREYTQKAFTKHGAYKTREYAIWAGMKARCYRPNAAGFAIYGGRGITVCPEWISDFPAFLAHIGPCPSDSHSIDRIDSNGNYEPGNVKWATRLEQQNNTRVNRRLENGETFAQAARRVGLTAATIAHRVSKGLPLSRILDPLRYPNGRGNKKRPV